MKTAVKERWFRRLIAVLLVWPWLHFHVVEALDMNPWRLYGFAMYCTPHEVRIRLVGESGDRRAGIGLASLPQSAREEYTSFRRRRQTLGRLATPTALAARLLKAKPALDSVEVVIAVTQLHEGRMHTRQRRYRYVRTKERDQW